MDIAQIEAAIALSEELHFGRAAKRLGISQPGLSQRLQRLEADLGVSLFFRSHKRVTITEAGQAFLPQARAALKELDSAVETARRVAAGKSGSLHVGFVENASLNVLPAAVSAFRKLFPDIHLRLSELISAELFERVRTGRLDLALMRPLYNDTDIETQLILREPYLVALPEQSDLARNSEVQIAELARLPMIIAGGAKATYLRTQFSPIFAKAGYEILVGQEVNQLPAILGLVSSGIGYAIIPRSVSELRTEGIAYRPLAAKAPSAELVAAWSRKSDNSKINDFLRCIPTGRNDIS
ncbi:LysR substrate-binding domain-containing protein [uncultured Jannaschia sp.]|uniref:LysR family transcriptional regulator n=1 Tax=uncultured Jannaschia sp. TaxID=293347 RepID=UPI00261F138F|nr:LysR substrate-binding domain-containing protein [uncultured Jannaschia sp.]